MRIRIAEIDTPETFGPRCENELTLGLKAKKRLRELLDGGTVPRKHHGGFSDEARDCDRDVDGIAGPARGLAGSQLQPKPDTKRTTTCLEELASPVPPTRKKRAAELTRRVSEDAQIILLHRNPQRIRETTMRQKALGVDRIFVPMM